MKKLKAACAFLAGLLTTGACTASQGPVAPPPSAAALQLAEAADLAPLNSNFASGDLGGFTALDAANLEPPVVKDGWLVVRNTSSGQVWYSDSSAVMLYKYVKGNFMVETSLSSNLRANTSARSDTRYTSAGLMLRDPASAASRMRWIVYNVGYQDGFFGTELKTTRDANGFSLEGLLGNASLSTWFSNKVEGSSNQAKLRICRVAQELRFFIQPAGESSWREETLTGTTVRAGSGEPVPGVEKDGPIRLQRADLPELLQVGVMSNDIGSVATGESRFNAVSFSRIDSFDGCLR